MQALFKPLPMGALLLPNRILMAPLTRTRAEVIAELKDSQARMDYVFMGDTWVPRSVFMSERSVAEVRAEAARYNRVAELRSGSESRN